jgi:leucyl aminopeptidase
VTIAITASATAPAKVRADVLAVPIFDGRELGPGSDVVLAQLDGILDRYLTGTGFEAKAGQTIAVPVTNGGASAGVVTLVGLGPREQVTTETLRRAAAAAVRRAAKASSLATTLLDARPESMSAAEAAQAIAEGLVLGSYEFLKYKPGGKPAPLGKVTVLGSTAAAVKDALARGQAIGEAVNLARDLVNEPGGSMNAVDFAAVATRVGKASGLKVTVLDEAAIKRLRLGGLLGVNRGSANPPRFVKLEYTPTGRRSGHVALVGKGITFDSGGLSLKTADGMETMKTDMSGAAAVLATMSILGRIGSSVHVTGYMPLTDNMPSGTAIKPGDVLRIRNGKTVEVLNTDAEGRLVLADALSLAVEDQPEAIVDLATLTGAVTIALGLEIAGMFASHDGWGRQVQTAAARAGEAVWPLPLPDSYRQQITSDVADIRNTGNQRGAGAITAALFLREFAGDVPWVHLDIAGTARAAAEGPYTRKGGTGFGVRTLVELLSHYERPTAATRQNGVAAAVAKS